MYKHRFWDISGVDLERFNYRANKPHLVDAFNHSIQGDYFQGIESAYQYTYDVLIGIRPAGLAEIGACERFIYDLHREDLYFDEEEVSFVILVANQLKHPKGALAGQPFYLLPFMIFLLAQMYGFFYSESARETLRGERRFLKTFWAVARGNSKTVVGAIGSVVNMLTNQNGAPVGTCSATVQKQSRIAFEDISNMIRSASTSIRKRFVVLQNEIRVLHNNGKIIPTSKQANTLDGIRVAGLALCDEIHAHPDSSIVDVLSTGMASSKNPQLLMITTAGTNTQSYGKEMFDYSEEVACNRVALDSCDRFLSVMYKIDKADEANWSDESVWIKANPALGHAVNLEGLRAAYGEATRNAKARANFLTKHLNVFIDFNENTFLEPSELLVCKDTKLDIDDYKGKDCYLGLDLAGLSDLSSLVYVFPEDDGGITVFQKSYLPESAMRDLKQSLKDRYYKAQQEGDLVITPTEVTDLEYIKVDVANAYTDFKVKGFSLDAAAGGARFAIEIEEEQGIEPVGVAQGKPLSESAILLLSLIKSKKFRYSSNLLEWCFINALKYEFDDGSIKVIRNRTDLTKKIDICVATVIGLSQTILREEKQSIYEHKNIRFF
ncbi:TPA: terminase large subunit [Vibrio cholerae]|nr:terminase large subunit [Vibrio cholerae]